MKRNFSLILTFALCVLTANVFAQTVDDNDIANGAVGTLEIVDNSVADNDIANGAVGSVEIADNGVNGSDIAGTVCLDIFSTQINPSETVDNIDYLNLTDETLYNLESNADHFMTPVALSANNLRVNVANAPGGATGWSVTLRDDGVATSLSCDLVGASTTCTDTTNTPLINAGSLLTVEVLTSTSAPVTNGQMRIAFCFAP